MIGIAYQLLFASFGIKFMWINLNICANTLILCFDGLIDTPFFVVKNIEKLGSVTFSNL